MIAGIGGVALSKGTLKSGDTHVLVTQGLANLQAMLELSYRLTEMLF